MTWSYVGPSTSDKDEVRYRIGDTNTNDQQLSDEEIEFELTQTGGVLAAAIECCRALQAKYSRMVDKSVDGLRMSYSQRQKQYADMILTLTEKLVATGAMPYAGGISIADVRAVDEDPDRMPRKFTDNQFNFPNISANQEGYPSDSGPDGPLLTSTN